MSRVSRLTELLDELRYGRPIVVVSGLPRSGTSMTMKMLEAGGLEIVIDGVRTPDEDNPRGYFEDERVKDLDETTDRAWLRACRGKVLKVVSPLLQHLPSDNRYRVVFMRRDLREVLASQAKMLERRGEASQSADEQLLASYRGHLEKIEFQLRFRPNFDALYVDYRAVLDDPEREARRINEFLDGGLNERRMVEVVDPDLYRNRAGQLAGTG